MQSFGRKNLKNKQKEINKMALETLKDIKEIDGFKVIVMDELKEQHPEKFNESGSMDYKWFEKDIRPNNFIYVRNDKNSLSFTIQDGPIKENGINGCQLQTIIEAVKIIIEGLNKKFPCRENAMVITKLDEAMMWSKKRTDDREKRKVEGLSKA
jgi:arginine/lysine/ornithine decarboxylase